MTQAGVSERRLASVGELTAELLAELRRIAEAATPGPWELDIREYGFRIRMGSAVPYTGVYKPQHLIEWDPGVYYALEYPETDAENRQYLEAEANARHIATFDPPTALAMLDRIEALEYMVLRLYQDTVVPDTGYCHRCGCKGFHDETCAMSEVEELLGLAFEEDGDEWDDE